MNGLKAFCLAVFLPVAALLFAPFTSAQTPQTKPSAELPSSMQSGARIQFELWSWGDDESTRQKLHPKLWRPTEERA
jgi:hypothetical protein